MRDFAIEVLPGLIIALILLMGGGSLYAWRQVRRSMDALTRRVNELEQQRAAILRLEK